MGGWTERRGWLLRLACSDGVVGYGDCAPLPEAGTEIFAVAETALGKLMEHVLGRRADTLLDELGEYNDTPAARCGVECALLDILSSREGLPLCRWLNAGARREVRLNAMLGSLEADAIQCALEAVERGFDVLKVKLGILPLQQEIASLRALAESLPAGVNLRLDANGSWDETRARDVIDAIDDLPVESLEEPLANPGWDSMLRLQALAPWPIAFDESLRRWSLEQLFPQLPVHRLVLKPMVLGGLLPAMALAVRARSEGADCVVTSTVDSAAGVYAASHLAAALSGSLAHGLATSEWLKEDLGPPPSLVKARLMLDDSPGIGFTPRPGLCFL